MGAITIGGKEENPRGGGGGSGPPLTAKVVSTVQPGIDDATLQGFAEQNEQTAMRAVEMTNNMIAKGHLEQTAYEEIVRATKEAPNSIEKVLEEGHAAWAEHYQRADNLLQQYGTANVDPQRVFKNSTQMSNYGAALNVAVGQMASVLTGTPNTALAIIDRAVARDVAAQEYNIATKGKAAYAEQQMMNLVQGHTRTQVEGIQLYTELRRKMLLEQLAAKVAPLNAKNKSLEAEQAIADKLQATNLKIAEIQQKASKQVVTASVRGGVKNVGRRLAAAKDAVARSKAEAEAAKTQGLIPGGSWGTGQTTAEVYESRGMQAPVPPGNAPQQVVPQQGEPQPIAAPVAPATPTAPRTANKPKRAREQGVRKIRPPKKDGNSSSYADYLDGAPAVQVESAARNFRKRYAAKGVKFDLDGNISNIEELIKGPNAMSYDEVAVINNKSVELLERTKEAKQSKAKESNNQVVYVGETESSSTAVSNWVAENKEKRGYRVWNRDDSVPTKRNIAIIETVKANGKKSYQADFIQDGSAKVSPILRDKTVYLPKNYRSSGDSDTDARAFEKARDAKDTLRAVSRAKGMVKQLNSVLDEMASSKSQFSRDMAETIRSGAGSGKINQMLVDAKIQWAEAWGTSQEYILMKKLLSVADADAIAFGKALTGDSGAITAAEREIFKAAGLFSVERMGLLSDMLKVGDEKIRTYEEGILAEEYINLGKVGDPAHLKVVRGE